VELTKQDKIDKIKEHFGPWSVGHSPEIGDGWIDLVYDVHCQIVKIKPDYKIAQIKQKFKGLRYYIEESNYQIDAIIAKAENASYEVCEVCGGHVDFDDNYLGMTLCDEHKRKE
jgi:hypothetical protein